jgi:mono/diheme cytochrome c family protein
MKKIKFKRRAVYLLLTSVFFMAALTPQGVIAHGWKAPKEAAEKQNPIEKSKGSINFGKELYTQFCADCHGKSLDGNGPTVGDLKTKPPHLMQRVKHHSDGDFFWKIQHGKGEMPSFKEDLQEKEIWHIINYIKSLVK